MRKSDLRMEDGAEDRAEAGDAREAVAERCGCGAAPTAPTAPAAAHNTTAMFPWAESPGRQRCCRSGSRGRGRGRWSGGSGGGGFLRPLGLPVLLALAAAALLWPSPAAAAPFPPLLDDAPPPQQQLFGPVASLYPSQEEYEAVRNTLRLLEPELELEVERALLMRELQASQQMSQALQPPPPPPPPQPEGLPAPMPLVALDARENPPVKKMKSYMSLCLFKICNMGRKRTN